MPYDSWLASMSYMVVPYWSRMIASKDARHLVHIFAISERCMHAWPVYLSYIERCIYERSQCKTNSKHRNYEGITLHTEVFALNYIYLLRSLTGSRFIPTVNETCYHAQAQGHDIPRCMYTGGRCMVYPSLPSRWTFPVMYPHSLLFIQL